MPQLQRRVVQALPEGGVNDDWDDGQAGPGAQQGGAGAGAGAREGRGQAAIREGKGKGRAKARAVYGGAKGTNSAGGRRGGTRARYRDKEGTPGQGGGGRHKTPQQGRVGPGGGR